MIYVPFPTLCFDHFLEANYPSRAIFWSAKIEPPMRKSEKQFLDLGRDWRCPEFPADAGADGNCKKRWIPIGSEGRSIVSQRETPWVPKFRLWKKAEPVRAKLAPRSATLSPRWPKHHWFPMWNCGVFWTTGETRFGRSKRCQTRLDSKKRSFLRTCVFLHRRISCHTTLSCLGTPFWRDFNFFPR